MAFESEVRRIDGTNEHLHQGGYHNFGGFYIAPHGPYEAGHVHAMHDHPIDHLTNLVRGAIRVHWESPAGDQGVVEVLVPAKLGIKAGFKHRIEALVDDTVWECWFAEAEADKAFGVSGDGWMKKLLHDG